MKLLESPEQKLAGNLRKKRKNSKEFKKNLIKLIKLKNRKKNFKSKILERNLKKSWEVFDELVQNYSKANFGTAFKINEIFRKIWQN